MPQLFLFTRDSPDFLIHASFAPWEVCGIFKRQHTAGYFRIKRIPHILVAPIAFREQPSFMGNGMVGGGLILE